MINGAKTDIVAAHGRMTKFADWKWFVRINPARYRIKMYRNEDMITLALEEYGYHPGGRNRPYGPRYRGIDSGMDATWSVIETLPEWHAPIQRGRAS